MHRVLLVFALVFVVAAPMALAAGRKAAKNPVVNLTGHVNPGRWSGRLRVSHDGKVVENTRHDVCVTKSSLRDALNWPWPVTQKVKNYSLHGNHLYVEWGRPHITEKENLYFDDPDHMHGKLTMHDGHNSDVATVKMHRVPTSHNCSTSTLDMFIIFYGQS